MLTWPIIKMLSFSEANFAVCAKFIWWFTLFQMPLRSVQFTVHGILFAGQQQNCNVNIVWIAAQSIFQITPFIQFSFVFARIIMSFASHFFARWNASILITPSRYRRMNGDVHGAHIVRWINSWSSYSLWATWFIASIFSVQLLYSSPVIRLSLSRANSLFFSLSPWLLLRHSTQ